MKSCIWLIILSFALGQSLIASDADQQQEAIVRLEQAISKTDIFELPSFVMKADVQIEDHGKMVSGTYELLWNGPITGGNKSASPGTAKFRPEGRKWSGFSAARTSSRFQFTLCAKLLASDRVQVRPSPCRWFDWLL